MHTGSEASTGKQYSEVAIREEEETGEEDARGPTGLTESLCPGPLYICRGPTRPLSPAYFSLLEKSSWTVLTSCPSRALEPKVMCLPVALV